MEKKSEDFSLQDALELAKNPAARQLMALLQQWDEGKARQAMDAAASGDYQKAGNTLQDFLSDPQARSLLQQLRR